MLNVLSLFSGIGAFEKALERERVLFKIMNFCEIDKYASKSYCAIHGVSEQINLRDVSSVNTAELHDVNLITYGFPCQDISAAGRQKGFFDENGNVTRSGLFFEALKIIKDTKPEYAIAENVKALTSKKFTAEFATVLDSLEQAGYHNYYKVLNAKDFGIPQNRERVFIVSIRKDVDFKFTFPMGEPLKLRLADLLENEVDSKFYLSDEQIKRIKASSYCQDQRRIQINEPTCGASRGRNPNNPSDRSVGTHHEQRLELNRNGTCNTLTTVQKDNLIVEPKIIQVMHAAKERNFTNPQSGHVYNPDGLSPCLNTMQGGGREPKIIEPNVSVHPLSKKREFDGFHTDFSPCLLATDYKAPKCTLTNSFRVRKLTPKECWRLMGFDDEDFNKARNAGISNSQLYKQAGNSIVVNVLQAIFRQFNFEKVSAVDCKYEKENNH